MTTVDIGDPEEARAGLVALVVTVVELLLDALEREAVRRMQGGDLDEAEIERLGAHLAALEEEVERLKDEEDIEDEVARLRDDLDGLVRDALRDLNVSESGRLFDPGGGFGDR